MDFSTAGGSLVLPGALVATSVAAMGGLLVWVVKQWMKAQQDALTNALQRIALQDAKIDRLTDRLDSGLIAKVDQLHDSMMARFQDLQNHLDGKALSR